MRTVVVVNRRGDWRNDIAGVEVVLARDYLTKPEWSRERGARIFNLCRSYRYQSKGYYVSLLAVARRHRPFPDLMTVLDMKSRALVRNLDEEVDAVIQRALADIKSDRFELSVYFGKNMATRHDRLARGLFGRFPVPLMRASFVRKQRWRLVSVAPLSPRDVKESHRDFMHESATAYFARPRYQSRPKRAARFDLAILFDPEEQLAPSDPKALAFFRSAAEEVGFNVEMIQRDDYRRLGEFDALFLRETTAVNHHTFRFAQRAEAEGLIVIDDPESILRCTNKVFQTETFTAAKIPVPNTLITDRADPEEIAERIGFPCVLKTPDSAFSQGVVKCADAEELARHGSRMLEQTDLLLVQEFLPSDFDWRIGVLNGEALYACRYHMARGHWQIVKKTDSGRYRYGQVEPFALGEVPERVVQIALRATGRIGNGLYGVDLKQIGERIVVTEVNDNPNIDAGCEDAILGRELYAKIMRTLLERVEAGKRRAEQ